MVGYQSHQQRISVLLMRPCLHHLTAKESHSQPDMGQSLILYLRNSASTRLPRRYRRKLRYPQMLYGISTIQHLAEKHEAEHRPT